MFFVPDILSRKGPFSIIWLAAHYEKKITKSQIMSLNICNLIGLISSANIKISLRITCDLMIGLSKLIKLKSKFIANESDLRTAAIHRMAGQFTGRGGKSKSHKKSIDLPDDRFSVDLNLPEIYEFLDMNLPDPATIFISSSNLNGRTVCSRASITMQEIPPLSNEELLIDQEINDQLYGDVGSVDFNEFFNEVLPSPAIITESMPVLPPQNEWNDQQQQQQVLNYDDDIDNTLTGIITPPLPLIPSDSESRISQKRPTDNDEDFSSTIEKRRRINTTIMSDGNDILGSLELPILDESSIRSIKSHRRRPMPTKRIKIDYRTQISDNIFRQNILDLKNFIQNMLPDIFIGRIKLYDTCTDLFNNSKRLMNKNFDSLFRKACLNLSIEQETITTTTIEQINDNNVENENDQNEDHFLQQTLPSPHYPLIDDNNNESLIGDDMAMNIDYDDVEIPIARADDDNKEQLLLPSSNIAEFSSTDRTIIDEKFNETLGDLFNNNLNNDRFEFEQLNIYDNRKRTAILYFYNLLVMKNDEKIDLKQQSSIKQFNPIYIYRLIIQRESILN